MSPEEYLLTINEYASLIESTLVKFKESLNNSDYSPYIHKNPYADFVNSFNPMVDLMMLSDACRTLYRKFFCIQKSWTIEGHKIKKTHFVVAMFFVFSKMGINSCNHRMSHKAFFSFLRQSIVMEGNIECSLRTFYYKIDNNKTFSELYAKDELSENERSIMKHQKLYQVCEELRSCMYKTDFYKDILRRKHFIGYIK